MKLHADLTESIVTKYFLALSHLISDQTSLILFPTDEHATTAKSVLYDAITNRENIVRHTKTSIEFDNNSKLLLRGVGPTVAKGLSLSKLAIHIKIDEEDFIHILPSLKSTANIIWFS